MKTITQIVSALVLTVLVGCGSHGGDTSPQSDDPAPTPQPPQPANLIVNHGGTVIKNARTVAVFWGNWYSGSEKFDGLITLLKGLSGSNYANTINEYSGLTVTEYDGYYSDSSNPPNLTVKDVQTVVDEVCKLTNDRPDPNTVYLVYASNPAADNDKTCAWHNSWYCHGYTNYPIANVAYLPTLDGLKTCDPRDTTSGHSAGLAALANVTAHELLEAITDPMGASWYDTKADTGEVGDKCAWTFSSDLVELSNGSKWKIQTEWSNKAYQNSSGLPNSKSQYGCIYK